MVRDDKVDRSATFGLTPRLTRLITEHTNLDRWSKLSYIPHRPSVDRWVDSSKKNYIHILCN